MIPPPFSSFIPLSSPYPRIDSVTATVMPPVPTNLGHPHHTMSLQNTGLPARGMSSQYQARFIPTRSPPTHVIDLTDDTIDHQPSQSQPQSRLLSPATLGHPHHTMAPPNSRSPASTALSSQEGGMASYLVLRSHPAHIINLSDDTIQNCVNCFKVIQQGDHSRQMFAYTCGCVRPLIPLCGDRIVAVLTRARYAAARVPAPATVDSAASSALGEAYSLFARSSVGRAAECALKTAISWRLVVCHPQVPVSQRVLRLIGHAYCGDCVDKLTGEACPYCKVEVRRQDYRPLAPVRAGVCKRKKGKKVRFV